jgi:aminopeptidase N
MLEARVEPGQMMALARRFVAIEEDELIVQQLLGDLGDLFWRYLPADYREREGAALEALLWAGMMEAPSSSLKAAFFNAWRSLATTDDAIRRMRAVWSGELQVPGLPLSERDRTTLALHLAVRGAPGWAEVLSTQETRIENADRRERFRFIRPAVSADPGVRDSFFTALTRRACPACRPRNRRPRSRTGTPHRSDRGCSPRSRRGSPPRCRSA